MNDFDNDKILQNIKVKYQKCIRYNKNYAKIAHHNFIHSMIT